MSKARALRFLVTERLTAAAEDIFSLFERTLAEYEAELRVTREEHHPGRLEAHPWGLPGPGGTSGSTRTWTQPGSGFQLDCVKAEPQFSAVCVKTEESSQLPHTDTGDDWGPFSCSDAHTKDSETHSGFQLDCDKAEPQFSAVCVKTEESSQLPHTDTGDDWGPFSCSDAHTKDSETHSGVQLDCGKAETLFTAVCVKTEESSLLSLTDTRDSWEPFSCSDAHIQETEGSPSDAAPETNLTFHNGAVRDMGHQCPLCLRTFEQQSDLQRHALVHVSHSTDPGKHQCPVCLKTFGSRSNLQRHSLVHSGEKPFSCSVCDKSFNTKSYLMVHMRTHTGERPYTCPLCGKGFSHKSAFNFHVQTHRTEKPYSCSLCGKSFTVLYYLKVHMKTHSRPSKST